MSGFSIWHAVMVLMAMGVIAIAVAIVSNTKPGRMMGVGEFRGWALGYVGLALLVGLFEAVGAEVVAGLVGIAVTVYAVYLVRQAAARAQDNGDSKWLALLAIVPLANLAMIVYLCFDRSRRQ